jgi:hypothetical protein
MSRADLEREARNVRDLAKRARRLAKELLLPSDRERLNRFADETDERAAAMEAEAAALRPLTPMRPAVEQRQAEQQQQGKASPRRTKPTKT